ncbi:MAG: hypothetical protein IT349_21685 [Candidatus Eisenbacteria bacterium]|nr:hypothetical protein [Candidatus Eisenbacteria bacterium]
MMGVSRQHFYEIGKTYEEGGLEAPGGEPTSAESEAPGGARD